MRATATERAYKRDWQDFEGWCQENGVTSLPATAETAVNYIAAKGSTLKASTIARRVASISHVHKEAGLPSPTTMDAVRKALKALQRKPEGKLPLDVDDVHDVVSGIPDTIAGARDRALILLGFRGRLRRSELATLTIDDISFRSQGLQVKGRTLRHSRTAALCPARALLGWLAASDINEGPLFQAVDCHGNLSGKALSDSAVVGIIKRRVADAGFDAALYSTGSLRKGR